MQAEMDRQRVHVQPLTRRNSTGVIYQRDSSVEAQIGAALSLDAAHMIERARVRDLHSADYFQEETLVYLLREHHRRANANLVDALSELLLQRSVGFLKQRLQALEQERFEEAYDEVMAVLFGLILDLGGDRGDFLQVRYWVVLKRLAIAAFQRQAAELEWVQRAVPLGAPDFWSDEPEVRLADIVPDHAIPPERLALAREALGLLEARHRTAFILRYYAGWPIEDRDPSVPTISRLFDKTPRTIRNWLKEAEAVLRQWRGEDR